jgi:hypothetical protein
MPELRDLSDLSKLTDDVTTLARDAAYVAIGLGVLGFQRAQVQRVELTNRINKNRDLDARLGQVRANVSKSAKHLDGLIDGAVRFIESSLSPLEEQLPTHARDLAHKAHAQAREMRSQILGRVVNAA